MNRAPLRSAQLSFLAFALVSSAAPRPTVAADDSWMNCFAVVAGKNCTVDGSVMFAHNEDSGDHNPVHFWVVPAQEHQAAERRRLIAGGSEPFAEKTNRYIWCQMPGLRYSDTYFNEYGVAIATNGCHSRETDPDLTDGGITFMLRRIIAARATSARHGVIIAAELLGKYGYSDTGRTMTIADGKEAWLLNIARGKHWAAARVPDDKCAVIANHFSIHRVDPIDKQNFILSPGLIEHAKKRGWYDPKRDGEFDFATVYGTDGARRHGSNIRRVWRGYSLIAKNPPEEHWRQPTFLTPKKKLTVANLMTVLRDHYEGTKYDSSEGYTKCSPYKMGQPTICAKGTSFATVFQLRADMPAAIGCVMWIAMGRPDATAFVPWYAGIDKIPLDYATGDATAALKRHFDPKFKAQGSPPAFAAAQVLERRFEKHYGKFFQLLDGSRDSFERLQWKVQSATEEAARVLNEANSDMARDYLTTWTARRQARADQLVRGWSAQLAKLEKGVLRDGR